jgi:E3 ubiquitin-protein ligase FANCL
MHKKEAIQLLFFNELRDILEKIEQVTAVDHNATINMKPESSYLVNTNLYKQIIEEIDQIGWENIIDLDTDLNSVTFLIRDEKDREHLIQIDIHTMVNDIRFECHSNLPIQLTQDIKIPSTGNRLLSIIEQHKTIIHKIQEFISVMEELDRKTWILEPERPTCAHTMRRIAIGSHSSIQIEVNPLMPHYTPEFKFLGADSVINPLRETFHKRQKEWKMNGEVSLLQNLEHTLGIKFPSREEHQISEFSEECGICYSYKQGTKIPDKVCDNAKCCMPFHSACLVQWLRALQDVHQVFDTLSGKCPYCQEPISVKITS